MTDSRGVSPHSTCRGRGYSWRNYLLTGYSIARAIEFVKRKNQGRRYSVSRPGSFPWEKDAATAGTIWGGTIKGFLTALRTVRKPYLFHADRLCGNPSDLPVGKPQFHRAAPDQVHKHRHQMGVKLPARLLLQNLQRPLHRHRPLIAAL